MLLCKSKKYYIFWVCVCSLSYSTFQSHAPHYIVICGLTGRTISFCSSSYMAQFKEKSYWTQNACFDFLYNFCVTHFSFREELNEIWSQMYIYRSACKVAVILVRFEWKLEVLESFEKNIAISNFMKIHPVADELFRADGRMDIHDEADSRFPQFC